jgi:hypothetical protein
MNNKNSKWITVVGGVTAFLLVATIAFASPPPGLLVAPLQATGDADKVDGHHAAYSGATTASARANKVLWATSGGTLHMNSMPKAALDNRYVNDNRAESIVASSTSPVLKVQNTNATTSGGYAIAGVNASGNTWRPAIYGENKGSSAGVYGRADGWHATVGWADSNWAGVYGYNGGSGDGVSGESPGGIGVNGSGTVGVRGESSSVGVLGIVSGSGVGVKGRSDSGVGVWAEVAAGNVIEAYAGSGMYPVFYVDDLGNVHAAGTFNPGGSDLAEMLPGADGLEAGDVLVVGPDGRLSCSTTPNSTDVVGVYSTQPGFVGGSGDGVDLTRKVPLAIVGVVPVKASAENGGIQPGDLLTTSSIPGHAMKASPATADGITFYLPGTILGKALEPLGDATGVIQVLVTLQ